MNKGEELKASSVLQFLSVANLHLSERSKAVFTEKFWTPPDKQEKLFEISGESYVYSRLQKDIGRPQDALFSASVTKEKPEPLSNHISL